MKIIALTLLLMPVLWLSATAQTAAPTTAQQVFDKYIAAIGGKEALLKVNDVTMSMSSSMNGAPIMMLRKQKLPNKFSMVINAMGMEVFTQVTDGQKVAIGGMQGNRTLEGAAAQPLIVAGLLFPELHYGEAGVKSEFAGAEKLNGKNTYKIINTLGTTTWTSFYDVTTGLKIQSNTTSKDPASPPTSTGYSNYKPVNGVQFPMTLDQQSQRGPMTIDINEININKGVRDSDFTAK